MASCFDFRMRTSSFDLHQLARSTKMARFSRLFRSKSESDALLSSSPTSPKASPKAVSPGNPHRRRFVRVVRNAESEGEEYENPHIVRKYSKEFWESTQMPKSQSLETVDRPLPYTVSGNTILKKHGSVDSAEGSPPTSARHAIFSEDVQVIEFDKREKIKKRICYMHDEKLQDSSDDTDTSSSNPEFELKKHRIKGKKVPVADYSSEDDSEAVPVMKLADVGVSECTREQLTLSLLSTGFESNGVCSPVKEEDPEVFNDDSGSEASSEVSEDGPLRKRDWTEEEDVLTQPSIAAKIMSVHAVMKQDAAKEEIVHRHES